MSGALGSAAWRSLPLAGLLGATLGTLGAVALIPDDPYPAGALAPSAWALTAGLLLMPALAALGSLKAALRLDNVLLFGLVYWLLLDLLQGVYPLYGLRPAAIEGAFLAIGLFAGGIALAGAFAAWRLPRAVRRSVETPIHDGALLRLVLLFFALGMVKFAHASGFNPVVMVESLGLNRWAAPWARGRLGGWDAFLDHMAYFGYLVPVLAVALATRRGWLHPATVMSLALSLIMLAFLAQGGGRRIIGVAAGAALVYYLLAQRRLSGRHLVAAFAGVTLLLYSMEVVLAYRNVGLAAYFEDTPVAATGPHVHVDDNFFRLAQVIQIVPQSHPYIGLEPVGYALIRPVPRVFWPGKPTDPGFDLAEYIGEEGVSLSVTVLADWYLVGGFAVVLAGGWLYGQLARAGHRLLAMPAEIAPRLLYSLLAMALFAGLRSLIDLVLMSYMVLAWMLGWWLLLRRARRAPGALPGGSR